jgi:hypothetical protein
LNKRLKLPDILKNEIDYVTVSSLKKLNEGVESLRQIIDNHEKAMIQQIEENSTKERKRIEEYEKRLQSEQKNVNIQTALFETLKLTKNNTKLLQLKQELTDYVHKTFEDLIALETPTATGYSIEGLEKLEELKENILQYGHAVEFPPYSNTELMESIVQSLNNQAMKIVTDMLRNNLVHYLWE